MKSVDDFKVKHIQDEREYWYIKILDDNGYVQFMVNDSGILFPYNMGAKDYHYNEIPILSVDEAYNLYGWEALNDALEYGSTSIWWWVD